MERTKDAGRKSTIKMLLPSCTPFGLRFSWIPDKVKGGLIVRVDRFARCPGSLLSKRAIVLTTYIDATTRATSLPIFVPNTDKVPTLGGSLFVGMPRKTAARAVISSAGGRKMVRQG